MSQLKPQFLRTYAADEIAPYFGLSTDDLLPNAPIQTVSTGTPMLMIPVKDLDVLRRVKPNMARLAALRAQGDFFSPHVFCVQGVTPQGHTFARQFGASPDDVWEDPYTGSATGSMGAYLWHYTLIDSPNFIAEQGHWMGRPGTGTVEVVGPRNDIATVKVGGSAVTVIRGEMTI
jgi:trans-2,3-dihydro-3-hydroxyanthranilate isomerase